MKIAPLLLFPFSLPQAYPIRREKPPSSSSSSGLLWSLLPLALAFVLGCYWILVVRVYLSRLRQRRRRTTIEDDRREVEEGEEASGDHKEKLLLGES